MAKTGESAGALVVPSEFRKTALAFPDMVKAAIAKIDRPEVAADAIAMAQAVADYGKRIKATTEEINHVEYGKLMLAAQVGKLCPALTPQQSGERGARQKKDGTEASTLPERHTLADYRKLYKYDEEAGWLERYWKALATVQHELEMSIAGCIRFIGADGNLKSNQNKGVIEWYTPERYIEAAREVMGSIDLDPASSKKANRVVRAEVYYTQKEDGLERDWKGNVFLNPPFKASLIQRFVAKLCESVESGQVPQAVLLTNNNTDTQWWHRAVRACGPICFTEGRVPFYSPAGEIAQPTNGHTFFYFGQREARFAKLFKEIGMVMVRR